MDQVRVDPRLALRVPASLAQRSTILPFCSLHDTVYVACESRDSANRIRLLSKLLGPSIRFIEADSKSLKSAIARTFDQAEGSQRSTSSIRSKGLPENAIESVDRILRAAVLQDASDIHFRPEENELVVELRVDGELEEYERIPSDRRSPVINRLKVLAKLDIAEKRAPQDGRTAVALGQGRVRELRVSSLPTQHGERVTLRVHATHGDYPDLPALGLVGSNLQKMERALAEPNGLILLTGPTGSGKSTTLYAAIEHLLRQHKRNVITIEDPIEYRMEGVSQIEVDSADKVNFGRALRSILRHDPDVVMIGEIRDQETAEVAIKAALTGHLVLSTLHTNNAIGVVTRLKDMGVDPYLIAATLRLTVAQRLVRSLCSHCRSPKTQQSDELLGGKHNLNSLKVFAPVGCMYCAGKGYRGRSGIFELVSIDHTLANAITSGVSESALIQLLQEQGQLSMFDDAVEKMESGITSPNEILSAVSGRL